MDLVFLLVLFPYYFCALWVLYVAQLFIHKGCECVRVTVLIQGVFKGLSFRVDNEKERMICPA